MKMPTLLETRPPGMRVVMMTVPAAVMGLICGVALDISAVLYLVLIVIAVIGGVLGGLEHRSIGQAAVRGLIGGFFFGVGLIVAEALVSGEPTVALPDPRWIQVVITTVVTAPLAMLGATIRRRAGDD